MSVTTSVADATVIMEFPDERQELRWRGFLGAERIERYVGRPRRVARNADDAPPSRRRDASSREFI